MRELDELLLNYLEQRYESAPDKEKAAFCALLELPDPDLVSYLLQQERPVPEVRIVVDYILKRT
jgi:succinate dehydrogenase flavin-adding protein (antitoxin of CptAB toxin-antitoxin module)